MRPAADRVISTSILSRLAAPDNIECQHLTLKITGLSHAREVWESASKEGVSRPQCSPAAPFLGEQLVPERPRVCGQVFQALWQQVGGRQCAGLGRSSSFLTPHFCLTYPYSDILGHETEDSWGLIGGHTLSAWDGAK